MSNERGLRYNDGKLRMDLIPPEVRIMLAQVLSYGAQKYTERNWELGMPYSEMLASLYRHLSAWEMGQMYDYESGLPHLWHVMFNVAALAVYEERGIGEEFDDRVQTWWDSAMIENPVTPRFNTPDREESSEPPAQKEQWVLDDSTGSAGAEEPQYTPAAAGPCVCGDICCPENEYPLSYLEDCNTSSASVVKKT